MKNTNIPPSSLFIPGQLLEEIVTWSKEEHAKIVYRKCIRLKKIDLANKIALKYNLREHIESDVVIACGLALLAGIYGNTNP